MALSAADLGKLVEKVQEAEKLLARRTEVEREIAAKRKELDRLDAACEKRGVELQQAEANIAAAESRFQHECRRHQADLQATIDTCTMQKQKAEADHASTLVELDRDIATFRVKCATEHRDLEDRLLATKSKHTAYLAAVRDLKARIAALPE